MSIVKIFGLFLALLSLYYGYSSINLALYQMEYPDLNVTYEIDEENGRLKIFIKNTASRKETGTINFYRLEVSHFKPHMQLESLNPGENITLNLAITIGERNYTIPQEKGEYPLLTGFSIPAPKLYFITEKTSITYKITCDNCYPQGVIKRIPEWQMIEVRFSIDANYTVKGHLPTYSWVTYSLEDLPK